MGFSAIVILKCWDLLLACGRIAGSRLILGAVQGDALSRQELAKLKEPLVLNITAFVVTVGAAPVPVPNLLLVLVPNPKLVTGTHPSRAQRLVPSRGALLS